MVHSCATFSEIFSDTTVISGRFQQFDTRLANGQKSNIDRFMFVRFGSLQGQS
jgi:hypothetical protein